MKERSESGGQELFYVDKNGKKQDASLHKEMLNISPEGEDRVLAATRSRTKQLGMDPRVNFYLRRYRKA